MHQVRDTVESDAGHLMAEAALVPDRVLYSITELPEVLVGAVVLGQQFVGQGALIEQPVPVDAPHRIQ